MSKENGAGVAAIASAAVARPSWHRAFENLPREHGFESLRVEGSVPPDLSGTFYWNGPGLFSAFGQEYGHWFDGDGAVGAVRFGGGAPEGAVRVVQTRALLDERRAGRLLYSRALRRSPRPVREHLGGRRRNPANVNIIVHDGRLLALGQGSPVELSFEDLATLGELDPDDAIVRSLCAHPRYSARRRALYGFGCVFGRRSAIEVYELRDGGARRCLATIPIAAPALVHDCCVTENHVLLVVPPLRVRVLPLMCNALPFWKCLDWSPAHGSELLLVPIDAPERVTRITMPAFFAFHFANAYETRRGVVVDLPCSEDFEHLGRWLSGVARGDAEAMPDNTMRRLVADPQRRSVSLEPIDDAVGEMPRVSPLVQGEPHRFVYHAAFRTGARGGMPDLLRKLDVHARRGEAIDLGADTYPSEAVVVPRAGGGSEDAAYLLTLVYDGSTHTSHVAILDAALPASPPLARVHFDHHVPFTFHGSWAGRRSAPARALSP
ncbi:MAG: carotenoid oxygenase family protein [Myxococcota bacterium]|nr:carotenoid oxygenase family protein [Myxococcota bacterium]